MDKVTLELIECRLVERRRNIRFFYDQLEQELSGQWTAVWAETRLMQRGKIGVTPPDRHLMMKELETAPQLYLYKAFIYLSDTTAFSPNTH